MFERFLRFGGGGTLLILAALLAGCTTATSDLSASDVWVRAASASDGSTDMGSETAMPMDSGTPSMDMGSGTPAMEDSGTPAMSEASSTGGGVSAAYMTLTNRGGAADTLVSISTAAAGVAEIHASEMDSSGVMRMRPLTDGLEIPANGSVTLEPGGYHVMLMNLQRDLNAGDSVTLTLTFASGKTLTVEAEIRPPQ